MTEIQSGVHESGATPLLSPKRSTNGRFFQSINLFQHLLASQPQADVTNLLLCPNREGLALDQD